MLKLSNTLIDIPVMSLRTSGKVAMAIEPIINPNNLKIEGWYCQDIFSKQTLILLNQDIRDFVPQGIAINDHADLVEPDDLIRLKDILELRFNPIGKIVVSNHKRRIGKVLDFALNTDTMKIQKIFVSRPLYKSLTEGQLSIDRSQIIEVTNTKIVVKEADIKAETAVPSVAPATS